jgi:hypothetical protein
MILVENRYQSESYAIKKTDETPPNKRVMGYFPHKTQPVLQKRFANFCFAMILKMDIGSNIRTESSVIHNSIFSFLVHPRRCSVAQAKSYLTLKRYNLQPILRFWRKIFSINRFGNILPD